MKAVDTNKSKISYSKGYISSYKDLIASHINVTKKNEINPESLSTGEVRRVVASRIRSFDDFIKVVFAKQSELVSPRRCDFGLATIPEYYREGLTSRNLQIGPVKAVKFSQIEILGGSKNMRGFVLRDPLSESISWFSINYSNGSLESFLTKEVISYLVNKNILYEKLPKKHHSGRFVFFGGSTNHAHLIWEFLMRMPIIYNLFKGQDYRLVVTKESKNLVQSWFNLLGYPIDNLYFFDGDKINSFEEITMIPCLFGNFENYTVHPESFFEIRSRALKNFDCFSKQRNKVYISRQDASRRKMRNELEFIDYLLGFILSKKIIKYIK